MIFIPKSSVGTFSSLPRDGDVSYLPGHGLLAEVNVLTGQVVGTLRSEKKRERKIMLESLRKRVLGSIIFWANSQPFLQIFQKITFGIALV